MIPQPDLYYHPRNGNAAVYGHRLETGDLLETSDVYDASDGQWQPSPIPFPGVPIAPDNEAIWIRPSAPFSGGFMNKIECYSNWCYIDRLNGGDLVDGEKLIVRWPDGSFEQITVAVDRRMVEVMEQGGPTSIVQSRAYYVTHHRGIRVMVPLVDVEAERPVIHSFQ